MVRLRARKGKARKERGIHLWAAKKTSRFNAPTRSNSQPPASASASWPPRASSYEQIKKKYTSRTSARCYEAPGAFSCVTDRLGYHDRNQLVSDWDGTRGLHSRQVWTAAMLHHCRSCLLHPRFSPSHTECAYTVVPRIPDASAHRCHRQYNVEHFPWTTSTRVISTRIPRWAPPLSLIKHTVPVVRESRPLDRANEQRTNILLARSRS